MPCFKILVVFIAAQCWCHHITLQKGLNIQHHGVPLKILAYIQGKWAPFAEIETKSGIQKRELESVGVIPPVEEKPPAPVVEPIRETENLELASTLYGFQRPELRDQSLNRASLTRSVGTGLNTNIQGSLPLPQAENFAQLQPVITPQRAGEFYEGLPPLPISPVAQPVAEKEVLPPLANPVVIPVLVQNNPAPEAVPSPPPALFDKTRVRQYAVYAGDVILKYLSQFFNRARITFNRFTSPPPPTPVYEN